MLANPQSHLWILFMWFSKWYKSPPAPSTHSKQNYEKGETLLVSDSTTLSSSGFATSMPRPLCYCNTRSRQFPIKWMQLLKWELVRKSTEGRILKGWEETTGSTFRSNTEESDWMGKRQSLERDKQLGLNWSGYWEELMGVRRETKRPKSHVKIGHNPLFLWHYVVHCAGVFIPLQPSAWPPLGNKHEVQY